LTQANSPKIIIGGMSNRIEAFLDSDGFYMAGKSTTIILPGNYDLKILLAILNSKVVTFWYRIYFSSLSLAGGYLQVSPRTIAVIPIPEISGADAKRIISLVDKVTGRQDEKLIDEINNLVYQLYSLNQEEISIIEESIERS
jgi:hypothetical protein